jgi:HK97 family phage prohead protease
MADAQREIKSVSFTNIKAQSSGRVRGGIAAVFGNVDAVRDRIVPGAFARTIAGGAKRARFLWNHSYQHPPTASIKELREVTRDELPDEVLEKAPDATGGLLVKREYFKNDLSNWILEAIDADEINEMSFAYETVRSATVTEPVDGDSEKTQEIRELQELKLFDCSDVLWGCNPATVAAGAKNFDALPLGVLAANLAFIESEIKAGRRNAANDQKLLDLIHTTAVSLGAVCNPDDEESGKSTDPELGPDESLVTPLSGLKLRTARLRVAQLQL